MTTLTLNNTMYQQPWNLPSSPWAGHIPFAGWIVEELKPRVLVELGTHTGASYLAFCQSVRENNLGSKCFAVDTWQGDQHAGAYDDEIYKTLSYTHDALYAGFSQLMRMTFDEAVLYFNDGSIDLLHIDGLHTYEAVRHDFDTWLPKLSDRGVVVFHDTMVRERDFGVWKLWSELSRQYPSFEFHHSHGLGVLLVGADVPEALVALTRMGADEATVVLRLFEGLAATIGQTTHQETPSGETLPATDKGMMANPSAHGPDRLIQAHLERQLVSAQSQIAAVNLQLGKEKGHATELLNEIARREKQIELLNGELAERRKDLAEASAHLLAADRSAREHVAQSALVARDIQDLQRHIASQQDTIATSQADVGQAHMQLAQANEQIASLKENLARLVPDAAR